MAGGFKILRGRQAAIAATGRGNDGTGSKPAGAVDSTTANWYANLTGLSPGGSIYLAPGNYGDVSLYGLNFSGAGVTIYGQTGVNMTSLTVDTCTGITVKYVTVTNQSASGNGTAITFSTNVFFDHLSVIGQASPLDTFGGYVFSLGHWNRGNTNTGFTNSIINYYNSGISGEDSTTTNIQNNRIEHYSNNGIFLLSMHTLTIDRNYVSGMDAYENTVPPPAPHPDGIQLAGTGSTGNCDHVTITNNTVTRGIPAGAYAASTDLDGIYTEATDTLLCQYNAVIDCGANGFMFSSSTNINCWDNFNTGYSHGGHLFTRGGSNFTSFKRNTTVQTPLDATTFEYADTVPNGGPPTNTTYGTGADANVNIPYMTSLTDNAALSAWYAAHPSCVSS